MNEFQFNEDESLAVVIREAKIILADAQAQDVDHLTKDALERLTVAMHGVLAFNSVNGGKSKRMRGR